MNRNRLRGNRRLLNVAKACREANPALFTMQVFGRPGSTTTKNGTVCGSAGCALGNYAIRRDLQKQFELYFEDGCAASLVGVGGGVVGYNSDPVIKHFDITADEGYALFSPVGCGRAKTAIEAAMFIENFVAKRSQSNEPA